MIVTEAKLAANRRNSFFRKCGGVAPDEFRCQTVRKKTGQRCRHWKCRQSNFCRFHGGRRTRGTGRNNYKPHPIANGRISALQGRRNMPPIYKRYLKNTLSEVVNELCSATPYEQLQLFEEVALMRDAAGRSVSVYAAARSCRGKPD